MFGDSSDTITEERLILCEGWDDETYQSVAAKVKVNMVRKVRHSVANGHMPAGGTYLTEDEYAQAMVLRIMKERRKRIDKNPGDTGRVKNFGSHSHPWEE